MGSRRLASALERVLGAALVVAALAGAAPSCLERRDDVGSVPAHTRCSTCHGDPTAAGDFLDKAAPPRDLSGATDPAYPGVGAHRIHLHASDTHAAIACSECHVVPDAVDTRGHADDAGPAEVVFGPIATAGSRAPAYDAATRRCSESWCHRESDAVWTQPRSSADACGSCHGLPPPAPHPQSGRCDVCHGNVVDSERRLVAPELHVDGEVQVHDGSCTACHGSGDDPAPPADTLGNTTASSIGVGAHQAHLDGGAFSRPVECAECHVVPQRADAGGHADALPAEVALGPVATTGGLASAWDHATARCADTWCHAPGAASGSPSPSWVEPVRLGCTSCHGAPPPVPHPQMADCSRCHEAVVASDDVSIADRSRHVDGIVDVAIDPGCTTCHGSTNPAPDMNAHQTHVLGTPRSRAVECGECHVVPANVLDAGHVDTPPPAELAFSGVANAFGAMPSYVGTSCQGTSCHGSTFPMGHASGGTNTVPDWTIVDGTQSACGTCHGLPPPAPHPKVEFNPVCNACHENVAPDNLTFLAPELHVDGVVTFTVP